MALLQADEGMPSNAVSFGIQSGETCRLVSTFEAQQTPAGGNSTLPPVATLAPLPARESLPPLEGSQASPDLPAVPTIPPAPPLPALPPWADISDSAETSGDLADIDTQFQALQARYQSDLARLTTAYTAQWQARTPTSQGQLVEAYRQAQSQQQALYAAMRREWEALYARWHRLLLGQAHVYRTVEEPD